MPLLEPHADVGLSSSVWCTKKHNFTTKLRFPLLYGRLTKPIAKKLFEEHISMIGVKRKKIIQPVELIVEVLLLVKCPALQARETTSHDLDLER